MGHRYTPEEIQFLKDNAPGRRYTELTELFNRRFRLSLSEKRIGAIARHYKIYCVSPKSPKYTPEKIRFIRDNAHKYSTAELTELFNRRFGTTMLPGSLNSLKSKLGTVKKIHRYTPEQIQFLRENLPGRGCEEVREMFNRHFGLSLTKGEMHGICCNHRLHNGLQFQKGRSRKGIPKYKPGKFYPKRRPIGADRIENGLIKTKIADSKWEYKQRLIWEASNGPVPQGHVIIFADGNKSNFSPDNLLLVSRKELAVMNKCKLCFPDKDLTKAGKTIADLIMLVADREREIGIRPHKEKKE
jgi:hypothetical protein